MTNREELEALGLRIFERKSLENTIEAFVAQGGSEPPINVKVRLASGESEEDALGRLLTLAQEALS